MANSQGAFVSSGGTRPTLPDLSSYGGDGFSSATGINNNHQIAETSDTDSGYSHAVMCSNGTITTTARSSPAAPTPKATSTRSRSHPASDRPQDLPPARLIHAGRSGRLRGSLGLFTPSSKRTDTGGGPP